MRTVLSGALGECVHIAGVSNFLHMAETAGRRTIFLGPAISIEELLEAAPHSHGGQIVILNPERTLGALEFRRTLQDNNCAAGVIVAEA